MSADQKTAITALSALDDDLRRGMYAFIRAARRPVTRDDAAASVGISRKLAAFHLDKLVEVGLLAARYESQDPVRRPGRAPKVYEPVTGTIQVSLPERRHELLAEILAAAVLADPGPGTARDAAMAAAAERGTALGAAERASRRPGRLGLERSLTLAADALGALGFEPERSDPAQVILRNCPFHPLAAKAPDLVCAINQRFLGGFLDGMGAAGSTRAVLQPDPEACCVRLRAAERHSGESQNSIALENLPQ